VLLRLRDEGVPVVRPLAALARRRTFWRLRLLTELEPDALPLAAFCAADPAARRWAIEAAGVTCRLAFEAGLRHPDLHVDNVLCSRRGDRVRAVLVDLDRAVLGAPPGPAQRDAMLVRMAPGTSYPRHVHAGPEECFVLEGDLAVGDGLRLVAGDYQRMESGSRHPDQSTEGGCLLLLISSLNDELVA